MRICRCKKGKEREGKTERTLVKIEKEKSRRCFGWGWRDESFESGRYVVWYMYEVDAAAATTTTAFRVSWFLFFRTLECHCVAGGWDVCKEE